MRHTVCIMGAISLPLSSNSACSRSSSMWRSGFRCMLISWASVRADERRSEQKRGGGGEVEEEERGVKVLVVTREFH